MASTDIERINPPEMEAPRGWTHGIVVPAGSRLLLVAGQTATGPDGRVGSVEFGAQFDAALVKVLKVLEAAGGAPEHVARMTVYVTDLDAYRAARAEIGQRWRVRMGRHYPAMTLVEVSRLLDEGAVVEIEATAMLSGGE